MSRTDRLRVLLAASRNVVVFTGAGISTESGIPDFPTVVTTRTVNHLPKRVRLVRLSAAPEPLCVAAAYRTSRKNDQSLAVFLEELRQAANSTA